MARTSPRRKAPVYSGRGGVFGAGVELKAALAALGRPRVLVLGDPVLDVYIHGTTHRMSREAPVLVVREDVRELRLGGAANTAANLAALEAETVLAGPLGDDAEGASLKAQLAAAGIRTLDGPPHEVTRTKTRVLAGGLHTTKQQMLRLDREPRGPMSQTSKEVWRDLASAELTDVDAVVVSDYQDASATPIWAEVARAARALGKVVVVDSRYALDAFAGVTAVTPNAPEVEALLGRSVEQDHDAREAATELVTRLNLEVALLTRGREGMILAQQNGQLVSLPAFGGHEAVDVTGAGDTVAAAFTIALAAGLAPEIAAELANRAASIVVGQIGAATTTRAAITALDGAS